MTREEIEYFMDAEEAEYLRMIEDGRDAYEWNEAERIREDELTRGEK